MTLDYKKDLLSQANADQARILFLHERHDFLVRFLNEDLDRLNSLLGFPPWGSSWVGHPLGRLKELAAKAGIQWKLDPIPVRVSHAKAARILAGLFSIEIGEGGSAETALSTPEWKVPDAVKAPHEGLLESLADPVEWMGFTGSFFDGAVQKGYSDIDAVLRLEKGVVTDPVRLLSCYKAVKGLLKKVYDFQPLQHHGFFFLIPEEDQSFLDSFYPELLFSFTGSKEPRSFQVRKIQSDLVECRNAYVLSNRLPGGNDWTEPSNSYLWKELVDIVSFIPCILASLKGKPAWKPQALEKAREWYSAQALEALDWATKARSEFPVMSLRSRGPGGRFVARRAATAKIMPSGLAWDSDIKASLEHFRKETEALYKH